MSTTRKKKEDVKKGKPSTVEKHDPKPGGSEKKSAEDPSQEMTEKEVLLTAELDAVCKEVDETKARVLQMRNDNQWLQEEAKRVRLENQEYMSYMEKKVHKRQTAIISLSDHHQKELEDLKMEEQKFMLEFERKKAALMDEIMAKQNLLAKVNHELEELHEYKTLQQEQTAMIKDLENQIILLKTKHSNTIQSMKSMFLTEKEQFQTNSQQKINDMAKQANKDAELCLNKHAEKVRDENRQLRKELLLLIRKNQALHDQKRRLEDQRQELLMEKRCASDLRNIRTNKMLKAITSSAADDIKNLQEKK